MAIFIRTNILAHLLFLLLCAGCGEAYQPARLKNGNHARQADQESAARGASERRQPTLAGVVDGWNNGAPPEDAASATEHGKAFFAATPSIPLPAQQVTRPPAQQMPVNTFNPAPTIALEKRPGDMAGKRPGDLANESSR